MYFKNKIAILTVTGLFAAVMMAIFVLPIKAEAKVVSKQDQVLFIKEHLETAKRLGEEYQIPYQDVLARAAGESQYGTSEFARMYYNLTGYDCYPDASGEVVCHENGRFASYEDCLRATFELLADNYGMRGKYMDNSKGLAMAVADIYCPDTPGYGAYICAMIDQVCDLESQIVGMQEDAERAELEAKAKESDTKKTILAKLGDETIYISSVDVGSPMPSGLTAGATAIMHASPSVHSLTVQEAAEQMLAGNLGNFAEAKRLLGDNFSKVQRYLQYC